MIGLKKYSVKLSILILIFPLASLLLYGFFSNLLFAYTQKQIISQDSAKTEQLLMTMAQDELYAKVENLVQFIRYYEEINREKEQVNLRSQVMIATKIANNLYQNKETVGLRQIKRLIPKALNQLTTFNDIEQLFLLDAHGHILAHSNNKMRGKNIFNLEQIHSHAFKKNLLKAWQQPAGGQLSYYWQNRRNGSKQFNKQTLFIKRLPMFNWAIAASKNIDSKVALEQAEILNYIKLKAKIDDGYYFISDSNNQLHFQGGKQQLSAQELVNYRLEGKYNDGLHIAATLYIAQFDWYVTAVREVASIKDNIKSKRAASEQAVNQKLEVNFYILLFSWLLSIALSLYLSLLIKRLLSEYELELENTSNKLLFQSRQATIGELLPMIAHQWRQPINKIAAILALLRLKLKANSIDYAAIDQECQAVEGNIEFMSQTIDDFRRFYLPQPVVQTTQITPLIKQSLALFSEAFSRKQVNISLDLEDISADLYGNEFMQVMVNLLQNALEALPEEKGKVWINTSQASTNSVQISLTDNGKGIKESELNTIFDPYFSTKKNTMGLGLYMSKMIIEKHFNGSIKAEMINGLTRFTILISSGKA